MQKWAWDDYLIWLSPFILVAVVIGVQVIS